MGTEGEIIKRMKEGRNQSRRQAKKHAIALGSRRGKRRVAHDKEKEGVNKARKEERKIY